MRSPGSTACPAAERPPPAWGLAADALNYPVPGAILPGPPGRMARVHATSLSQLWHEAVTAEPLPPRLLILGTAVAALILVGWRRAWPLSRTAVTIAHEGGHALVALAVGRRLDGVRVHRSTAGLTA